MPIGSNLAEYMAGMYDYGETFRIFPRPGMPDWKTTFNHEFTHAVLGIATTTGIIHQLLAYLGYRSSSPRRRFWLWLYRRAIEFSQATHESAATFVSLCEHAHDLGLMKAFEVYKVPPEYRGYYLALDQIVPLDLSPDLRSNIGRAIATYAFDDPLQPMRSTSWDILVDPRSSIDLLPKVDERFHRLVRLISQRGSSFLNLLDPLLHHVRDEQSSDGSIREILAHRRYRTYERERLLRNLLLKHYGKTIEAPPYESDALEAIARPVIERLKSLFAANRDDGLIPFQRDFSDKEGEDPLLYNYELIMPNRPLSGLFRIPSPQFLVESPGLVDVNKAAEDCVLSETLILKKGQYYVRYFFFDQYKRRPLVFYSISDIFPTGIWSLTGTVVVIEDKDNREIDPLLLRIPRPELSIPVVVWLPRLSRQSFEHALSTPHEWEFEFANWIDCPGIATFFLFNTRRNCLWAANVTGDAYEIFAEEASANLARLSEDNLVFHHVLRLIRGVFPHVGPSWGVPVNIE